MYKQKKQEYIKKDAIAHILAKMSRWNITLNDLARELNQMAKR